MRAGAKFPAVLEQRLAECKVMLVLIGPEWLNSRDEQGNRRLDNPDDWVRLEIAQALKRDITVIPVRVNGADLPTKAALPEDIRGLLDHQTASVTNAGFRHDMSGITKDIRSIESPRSWRRFGVIAAGSSACLLAALAVVWAFSHLGPKTVSQSREKTENQSADKTVSQNAIWSASPGEWVLFGSDKLPVGYYFKPSASKKFGDYVVLTVRNPFKPADTPGTGPLGAYQDGRLVFDCKKDVFANPETTIYNKAGEIISHFKQAEPEALPPSVFTSMAPGSVSWRAGKIACHESLATSLGDQVKNAKLTYLSGTQTQDGDWFYGPVKPSEPPYQYEALLVAKLFQDHSLADLFAAKPVLNSPMTYRSFAQRPRFNCTDKKALTSKVDDFDAQGNWVLLNTDGLEKPFEVKQGTVFTLMSVICGPAATNVSGAAASGTSVAGTYEGTITTTYKTGGKGEQEISITVESTAWNDFQLAYKTAAGAQGQGVGKFENGTATSVSLQSTTPGCAGSYEASFKFADDAVTFSFKGEDCSGPMEGNGTAKKVKT